MLQFGALVRSADIAIKVGVPQDYLDLVEVRALSGFVSDVRINWSR